MQPITKLSKTEKAVATTTEGFVLISFIQYIIGLIAMFLMNQGINKIVKSLIMVQMIVFSQYYNIGFPQFILRIFSKADPSKIYDGPHFMIKIFGDSINTNYKTC